MNKINLKIPVNEVRDDNYYYVRLNQESGLKELYNLREENLRNIITLLNEPYMRNINKKYIKRIQKESTALYNSLTDIVNFIDSGNINK